MGIRKAQTRHISCQARYGPYILMEKSAPKAQLQQYIGLLLKFLFEFAVRQNS